MIPTLWRKRELLFSLVKRDLKTRYKSSVLGFLWSIGKPLFLSIIIIFVFSIIDRISKTADGAHSRPYSLFVLSGILVWFYFMGSILESLHSILNNSNLIKKIRIRAEVIPASVIVSNLIHFFMALIVYHIFYFAYKNTLHWEIILLPLLLLVQTLFITALALILSSLQVFYRDVGSIMDILLNAWFYLTPIIYPLNFASREIQQLLINHGFSESAAQKIFLIYCLNPMATFTMAYRRLMLNPAYPNSNEIPDSTLLMLMVYCLVLSIILYIIGLHIFKRLSPFFADEL